MDTKIIQADISHAAVIASIGKKSFRAAFEHLFRNREELFEYLEYTYDPIKLAKSITQEHDSCPGKYGVRIKHARIADDIREKRAG